MRTRIFFLTLVLFTSMQAHAKLNIVTTTTDLKALCEEIGGDKASVESLGKGTQDPHFIEAKPSYMVKVSRADLLVSMGLELEIGWLPSIIQGARNPGVKQGSKGYLEVGQYVEALEVAKGDVSRADGDVHPSGNPHFNLDPIRMSVVANVLAKKMGDLDSANAAFYNGKAKEFENRMRTKTAAWQARIQKSGVKKVVSYHKTLTYFFNRFQIENPAILEPKPGVPPTSGHIIDVIALMKRENIKLIMIENYFDPSVSKKIEQEIKGLHSETVPVAVEGAPQIKTLDDLYENLVATVEKGK